MRRRPRPPPLYRLSRTFQRIGIVVVVIIIAYLAFAGYSIFKLSASDVNGLNTVQPSLGNQSAGVSGDLSITNPGVAPVNSISFKGLIALKNGIPIGSIGLPSISLGPGAAHELNFSFRIALAEGSPAATLLFQDNALHILFALNVTYAYLFNLTVLATGSFSWGAPFYGFNTSATVAPGNGSVDDVTYGFTNHARFTVGGALLFNVTQSDGTSCGGAFSPALDVGSSQSTNGTVSVEGNSGCFATATSIQVTYFVTPRISIVFPTEPLT